MAALSWKASYESILLHLQTTEEDRINHRTVPRLQVMKRYLIYFIAYQKDYYLCVVVLDLYLTVFLLETWEVHDERLTMRI